MPQKTLAGSVICTGVSLHAGTQVSMEFKPAPADTGIVFHVHAEDGEHLLSLRPEAVSTTELATTISNGKVSVSTIEHVLSSLRALDIDNVEIHVVGCEVPLLDGSAKLIVEALDKAILAGVIGVALVMLFMLLRYRLCGLVADIALTIYVMIVVLLLALTGAQLTLPGVAGIILGIGMAVDANVVIFERIREELAVGRPLPSSVKKGFANALSAIIDANITTIIAAVVLYAFGTGSIRGFALTLGIGVATSMFTAIFVTHKLLDIFVDLGIKNQKLYV